MRSGRVVGPNFGQRLCLFLLALLLLWSPIWRLNAESVSMGLESWQISLPLEPSTPLVIGVGSGLWQDSQGELAARSRALEALARLRGVRIEFQRQAVRTGLGSSLHLQIDTAPSAGAEISDAQCIATFWEAVFNLTWCMAISSGGNDDAKSQLSGDWLMDAHKPPDWLNHPEAPTGWRTGVGAAGRTVRPSDQLELAERRALQAIAEQNAVEIKTELVTSQPRGASFEHSAASGIANLVGAHTIAVWRAPDGHLYVLMAARATG